jgi:hypothetical protein
MYDDPEVTTIDATSMNSQNSKLKGKGPVFSVVYVQNVNQILQGSIKVEV